MTPVSAEPLLPDYHKGWPKSAARTKRERWLTARSRFIGAATMNMVESFGTEQTPATWGTRVVGAALLAWWFWTWWEYRKETKTATTAEIPEGFVQVTIPGKPPVVVPPTPEAVAAIRHLVDIVRTP